MTKTISYADQLEASRQLYENALSNIETMSDGELRNLFASDATVARVLSIASDATVARVLGIASADTVARVLGIASADTVARVLSIASADTVDRVLGIASDATVERVSALHTIVVPIVDDLDRKVAEAAGAEGDRLDMSTWHKSCGTTHCRAGWAVALAGEAGRKLESIIGTEAAGRAIYEASTGRIAPDFYASDKAALADIRRCAELQS